MLPEGAQREDLAKRLKVHIDNEFPLMSYLGGDLPGALIASPLDPADIPGYALEHRLKTGHESQFMAAVPRLVR